MSKEAENLNKWCEFFKGSNSDIFEIIKNAIVVAASCHPEEFKLKRGSIAETLFSKKSSQVDRFGDQVDSAAENKGVGIRTYHEVDMKEKQALSDTIDNEVKLWIMGGVSNKEEVLRKSTKGEGRLLLLDIIRRVEEFDDFTVDGLKAASIGKLLYELNALGSEQIHLIARSLVHHYIHIIDPRSAIQKINDIKYNKKIKDLEHVVKKQATKERKCVGYNGPILVSSDLSANRNIKGEKKTKNLEHMVKKQANKETKGVGSNGPRFISSDFFDKGKFEFEPIIKKDATNNPGCVVDATARFEASIKRLRDNYQEIDNAKRQRRIQVIRLQDLPKQKLGDTKACLKKKSFANNVSVKCLQV